MREDNIKGITLISLIVTIVVILILAGIVINTLNQNSIIAQAEKATFFNDIRTFQTELELYKEDQYAENLGSYDSTKLQADESSVTYNDNIDINKTIYNIIPSMAGNMKYQGMFIVVDGKLLFQGMDVEKQNWAREIGLNIVIAGEPIVSIISPNKKVIAPGTDIVYTIKFSSNVPLSNINLNGKIEITDENGTVLTTQPTVTIGTLSGTSNDLRRQVDITINTISEEIFKVKVKSGVATNSSNLSNSTDILSDAISNGIFVANTLLDAVKNSDVYDGTGTIRTTENSENIDISAEMNVFNTDITYSATPTLGNNVADQRMLVLKYNSNLTINSGVTFTPQVRKKGMLIYVNGDLNLNGTISMTARGAKAVGQNIYIIKNENSSLIKVPAVGAIGGTSNTAGANGVNGQTGGGGSRIH